METLMSRVETYPHTQPNIDLTASYYASFDLTASYYASFDLTVSYVLCLFLPHNLILCLFWPHRLILCLFWPHRLILSPFWPHRLILSLFWPHRLIVSLVYICRRAQYAREASDHEVWLPQRCAVLVSAPTHPPQRRLQLHHTHPGGGGRTLGLSRGHHHW